MCGGVGGTSPDLLSARVVYRRLVGCGQQLSSNERCSLSVQDSAKQAAQSSSQVGLYTQPRKTMIYIILHLDPSPSFPVSMPRFGRSSTTLLSKAPHPYQPTGRSKRRPVASWFRQLSSRQPFSTPSPLLLLPSRHRTQPIPLIECG